MVFSSITFLFFFLPIALITYYCSGKFKNITLLLISLTFYTWGEGVYLLVMLCSICTNYLTGLLIHSAVDRKHSKIALTLSLVFNFSILAFFKYGNFLVDTFNSVAGIIYLPAVSLDSIHLPIGISFFTFQAVSYNIDIYRGQVRPQKSLINIGLYISLFPQLIAGPIIRYRDIATFLQKRTVPAVDFSYGIERFLVGLSKKVLLANPLGLVADKIFSLPSTELNCIVTWLGAICYTLQIYYDFSGYSDMAIGLGRMFGFRFLENFNYPYISRSIKEFWRRWHISLSTWFRDYLYIPLGGNRSNLARNYANLLIVFLLCGLWHGANWTFVCWGLYHGFFLILERTNIGKLQDRLWSPCRHFLTLLIIIVGWVFFRSETIADGITYLNIMFGISDGSNRNLISLYLDNKLITELVFAFIFAVPLVPWILGKYRQLCQCYQNQFIQLTIMGAYEIGRLTVIVCLTYFTVISLSAGVYNPFIYFRF